MKKTTMQFIATYLTENAQYADENEKTALETAISELNAELNKGAEQKQKNAEAYESIHELIVENLDDTPCTCAELYEVIKGELPTDMGKGKVQYALNHLWQDEIVKIEGKPNTYRRA